jgi:rare lipoprotein A
LPSISPAKPTALAAALIACGAVPARAQEVAPPPPPTPAATTPAAAAGGLVADVAVPALFSRPAGLVGRTLRLQGRVGPEHAGRTVEIQRQDVERRWIAAATSQVGPDGAYLARWRADVTGRQSLRAVVHGAVAQVAAAPATTQVTLYRPVRATWFGPGFFGRRTACGQRLSRGLVGVAHRRLPCGTLVEIYHRGRTVTAPVVDRGPFGTGAHYDLTSAAARQVGMRATGTIGVVVQRVPAPAA